MQPPRVAPIQPKEGGVRPTHQAQAVAPSQGITLPSNPSPPRQLLNTEEAVAQWQTTSGFRAFWGWITRQCDRIKGKRILDGPYDDSPPSIQSLMHMLESMTEWVEEVPPQEQLNQRFGNLAFRDYIKLVEQRLPGLVSDFPGAPITLHGQILPLFIQSNAFGHTTRLDYGTGHELAYVLALWCCVVSGWVGGEGREDEEDELILRVFPRYLELVTLLQKTYRLEPAGSHGVWGLDDYCFFPYLFGSAQLLESSTTPSQALQDALKPSPSRPITDLYTLSLHRITLFKSGASFSEHSPLLNQLSSFPNWQKPHAGLRKMFMGEVVGKRVVVQGLWIGGWLWGSNFLDEDEGRKGYQREGGSRAIGAAGTAVAGTGPSGGDSLEAPWRTDGRARVLAETRRDWGSSSPLPPRQ